MEETITMSLRRYEQIISENKAARELIDGFSFYRGYNSLWEVRSNNDIISIMDAENKQLQERLTELIFKKDSRN